MYFCCVTWPECYSFCNVLHCCWSYCSASSQSVDYRSISVWSIHKKFTIIGWFLFLLLFVVVFVFVSLLFDHNVITSSCSWWTDLNWIGCAQKFVAIVGGQLKVYQLACKNWMCAHVWDVCDVFTCCFMLRQLVRRQDLNRRKNLLKKEIQSLSTTFKYYCIVCRLYPSSKLITWYFPPCNYLYQLGYYTTPMV